MADPFDPEQEFGVSKPTYQNQELRLQTEKMQADKNAMDLLTRAQAAQRGDMSPSQGIASALLAAIPTLGGYLIGKSVGAPKIPEGTYFKGMGFEDFSKINSASGGNSGGLAGYAVGQENQKEYAKSILEDPKILAAQAGIEAKRGESLQNDQSQLVQAGLTQDREDARLDTKGAQDLRNIRATGEESRKTVLARDATGEMTPEEEAAQGRILAGKEQPGDFSLLPPKIQKITVDRLRSQTSQDRLGFTKDVRAQDISFAQNNETVILDPSGQDPKLNRPRADLRAAKLDSISAIDELINSYDQTAGAFVGLDAIKEGALGARIYSGSRLLGGTGASLTGNEGAVITAMSAPNMTIDGILSFTKRYIQSGGDPAGAAREIKKALASGFEKKMNGYGQGFVEFHPDKVQPATPLGGKTKEQRIQERTQEKLAKMAGGQQ